MRLQVSPPAPQGTLQVPPRVAPRWRSAAELLLALPAGWALYRFLPLAAGDPFRSTLVILPAAAAALAALARHAPGRTGARSGGEGAVLCLLVLLTLGRRSFGLAATDWFLAAGYLLLLGYFVARLLLLWRPALGRRWRRPEAPPAAFFLLPLVVYLTLQPWQAEHRQPDGDEPYYLLIAHSLVHDFDADLADNYAGEDWRAFMDRPISPQPGDPRGPDGEIYSRHNALLPLLLAPAYFLAGRWGAMAAMAIFSAALAYKVLALALRGARPGAALIAYAVIAFSPPLLIYSYQIWIEVPAALVVLLALEKIENLDRLARPGLARPGELAVLALLLAALPLLKLRFGLVALPLAVLAVYRARPSRRIVLGLAAGATVAFACLLAYNKLRFGNLLKIHSWAELDPTSSSFGDFARGAVGMFYDVAFGLFPSAPIWFLAIPATWHLLRRRKRGEAGRVPGDLALVALPYLAALAPRFEWYGGWSPPFRYAIVFLPLFALVLAPLFELRHRPGLRLAAAAFGSLTVVLTLIWVVMPGWTYNFADGRTHLLDEAGVRLGADLARFFPSVVRLRLATWIWPPVSLLLAPLALWRGPGRTAPALRAAWRRSATALGFASVLVFAAALALLAHTWPTRTIEVEDGWVSKERGAVFPDPWVLERPRYKSGWTIPPRGRVAARVAPGGAKVRFRLFVRAIDPSAPARLRVAAGETPLATLDVPPRGWRELDVGPVEWPAGEPLVLRGGGTQFKGRIAVDRVECAWE